MKFYFSTKQIAALNQLSIHQRLERINHAAQKLTVPEKMLLNFFKLLIIVPSFVLVIRTVHDWWAIIWVAIVILLYPLIVRPIQYTLAAKYLNSTTDTKE